MGTINIVFPDGASKEFPIGTTGEDIAQSISPGLRRQSIAIKLDGEYVDLRREWQQKLDINQQIDVLINCAFPRTSDPKALAKGIQYTESLISDTVARNLKGFINISSQS